MSGCGLEEAPSNLLIVWDTINAQLKPPLPRFRGQGRDHGEQRKASTRLTRSSIRSQRAMFGLRWALEVITTDSSGLYRRTRQGEREREPPPRITPSQLSETAMAASHSFLLTLSSCSPRMHRSNSSRLDNCTACGRSSHVNRRVAPTGCGFCAVCRRRTAAISRTYIAHEMGSGSRGCG